MPAKIASGSDILYYGDNLTILRNRNYIKDESVDLVYIDPPFNSNVSYNVLFKGQHGSRAAAQIKAFSDTWRWDDGVSESFDEITAGVARYPRRYALPATDGYERYARLPDHDGPRLVELHRVLKPTGNLYLHCDPGASHYLKILLDAIFGPENFRNEIVWMRTGSKG
jgi:site-specific DNA-methyltransferase (adenine-specific)